MRDEVGPVEPAVDHAPHGAPLIEQDERRFHQLGSPHGPAPAPPPLRGRALAITPFFLDRLVAITAAPPPWRGRAPKTPAELAAYPLILYEPGGTTRTIVEDWFRRAGVAPRVAMELGNIEAIKKLVEAGLGLTIGSAVSVCDEVRRGALRATPLRPRLDRRLGVVVRRDKPRSPALEAVLAALAPIRKRSRPS
jgi:DNA-binding transcriptional LysR family regulator